MTNPADNFFGDSAKSAKFDTIGDTVGGPITHIGEARQQTDFSTGNPLTWQDGSPRMQLPVTVQTTLRDPSEPTDDGQRTLYVKGEMKKAIGQALRAAGAKMAVGGTLTVTYSGQEPTQGYPKKLYTATYTQPAPGQGFFEQPTQQAPQQQWPQQTQPAPQPAPQPAQAPQMTAEQYAAYQAWQAQQSAAPAQQPTAAPQPDYAAQMGFGQPAPAPLPPATDTPPF